MRENCGKRFSEKSSMIRHQRMHMGLSDQDQTAGPEPVDPASANRSAAVLVPTLPALAGSASTSVSHSLDASDSDGGDSLESE